MILHHQFIRQAKKLGGKLAIRDLTLKRDVTYAKALIAALMLARVFRKWEDGDVGVMIPTSAGGILAVLGVLFAGKVPVMINYSTGADQNCLYAQEKCGFSTIVTSKALLDRIGCPVVPGMVFLENIMSGFSIADKLIAALKSKRSADRIIDSLPESSIDDNLVILFTSGSEKDPKAVQLTHRNMGSNIQDLIKVFELNENESVMAILPLFHVFGFNANCMLPLVLGATMVTYANPLDYKRIPGFIRQEKTSLIAATPIFFNGYLRESKPGDFESIIVALAGADKVPEALRAGYIEKHGLELCEAYGTTETSPGISVNTPKDNLAGSIGRPLPGVQVKITDLGSDEPLPAGQEGKIWVKGDLVMKGYLDDIEETSLRIHNGWYDTGDMGLMDEQGYLWHKGRLRRFVKIGGEMVSLVRTERVLESVLPAGVECCVVDVPDSRKGARLVAVVTSDIEESAVIRAMGESLPPIAIPKQFMTLDDLPKMGSGKIDFRSITQMVRRGRS